MASFFKKALGVFLEFDEVVNRTNTSYSPTPITAAEISSKPEDRAEAQKFEQYFDRLFDKANFPGPDYYEFHKTMETLEAHIPDEKIRIAATYASLNIQGLTKQILIDSANKYIAIIDKDKADFELALKEKLRAEVLQRQKDIQDLEKKIAINAEQLQQLTKENTESQALIGKLKTDVLEQENKLNKNSKGYMLGSQAITNKINSDIQKIQSNL